MDAMTMEQRRAYRPEPCHECGKPARVVGWENVTRMGDPVSTYTPKRRCSDPGCVTRRGTLADPPA